MTTDVVVRPLGTADIPEAWALAHASLQAADRTYGRDGMPDLDDRRRALGQRRLQHAVEHDPEGAFVAADRGALVGVATATRRGPLWFLSLLAVASESQSQGIGRRLLDATLATLGPAGAICASDDPKALRRYRLAGFDLQPCYAARGAVDRALIPAIDGVRPGSYDADGDFIDAIATDLRGAPHGTDLAFFAAVGRPVYVTDTSAGRGYVICTEAGLAVVGATTARAAQSLLWTALAEATDEKVGVMWLRASEGWAIDVATDARLALQLHGSFCTRGAVGSMSPYIPNGATG